jgi:hypothetical protein
VSRLPKLALALIALSSIVVAGSCAGSSGTPTPPPITDPQEVVTRAIASATAIQSLHVKIEVSGKVNAGSLGGASGSLLSGNVDLTGTTVEGDVDIAKQAADLKLAVPALLGTTGEVVVVDGYVYTQISLSSSKFSKSKLSDTTGLALPSPGALASGAISDQIASLRKSLDDAGVVATLKPTAKVDGKDAYDISYSLPLDKINTLLGAAGGSATAGMTLDSAAVEIWVYMDDLRPAKLEVKGSSSTLGNLDVVVTLTRYNQAVTISAPAPSNIATS